MARVVKMQLGFQKGRFEISITSLIFIRYFIITTFMKFRGHFASIGIDPIEFSKNCQTIIAPKARMTLQK